MMDRTTKALLLAIAVGLWLHVVQDWITPVPAQAQSQFGEMTAFAITSIANGTCLNQKLC